MLRKVTLLLFICVPLLAEEFVPGCTLPFEAIKLKHPIDATCGIRGTGTDPAKVLQNAAKNNFCASGALTPVTFPQLLALQRRVEKPDVLGTPYVEPVSRAKLRALGEGKPVVIVAFLKEAHFADTDTGEGVNCKLLDAPNNDIHIALVAQAGADECTSVTAEMPPHFRPGLWEAATPDPHQPAPPARPRPPIPRLNAITRPVRIAGQLFFDASHLPCTPGHRRSPQRISSWEIHPVYSIFVCKRTALADCHADVPSDWQRLDEVLPH